MEELIKEELGDVLKKQPHKRLERIVIITLIIIGILASAGAINWFHEYQVGQGRVMDAIEGVSNDVKTVKKDVSSIKTEVSESKQIMEIVVKQLPPEPQKQTRQIQEIYNQMKRDQVDEYWKLKKEGYYKPAYNIQQLDSQEANVKKKLNLLTKNSIL